jgi:hypothetical protein
MAKALQEFRRCPPELQPKPFDILLSVFRSYLQRCVDSAASAISCRQQVYRYLSLVLAFGLTIARFLPKLLRRCMRALLPRLALLKVSPFNYFRSACAAPAKVVSLTTTTVPALAV